MTQQLHITKLDAARRQAETGIVLYFHDGDPVSIHTLSAAAYDIVSDVNHKCRKKLMLVKGLAKELAPHLLRPEQAAKFKERLNEAQNFFKHADRDPQGVLVYIPEQAEHLLFDLCTTYKELTGEYPPLFKLFVDWYTVHRPDVFDLPPELKTPSPGIQELLQGNRMHYFSVMLPLLTAKGAGGV